MEIMRLCKSYQVEILEAASREALDMNTCYFKYFNIILKQVVANYSKVKNKY
jgi:hypothetical protein